MQPLQAQQPQQSQSHQQHQSHSPGHLLVPPHTSHDQHTPTHTSLSVHGSLATPHVSHTQHSPQTPPHIQSPVMHSGGNPMMLVGMVSLILVLNSGVVRFLESCCTQLICIQANAETGFSWKEIYGAPSCSVLPSGILSHRFDKESEVFS
jgi:hypothetical protein